jgi:hypothetical protein
MHSINYFDTFIEVAEDCPVAAGEVPPQKEDRKTIADLQFEMLKDNPYKYTSDDVFFNIYAAKNNVSEEGFDKEKSKFFSKGQPCFRSSPLPKRYGWGVHSNSEGKIAIYAMDSDEYKNLAKDRDLRHLKAMRSKRS